MHTQLCIAAMAQFIETNRGGKNLHFEGYVYTKIRDGANSLVKFVQVDLLSYALLSLLCILRKFSELIL